MSMTVQDVINLAAMRSQLNDPTLLDTNVLIKSMTVYERQVFMRAAALNPEYFGVSGDTATRVLFTDFWAITAAPGPIAAVSRVVVKTITGTVTGVSVGDTINLITLRFPDVDVAPRAYIRGRRLFGYKNELGADSSNMVTKVTLFYAELPVALTTVSSVLTLPDEWIDLVVLQVAKLMCLRDRRPEDAQLLDVELKENYALFDAAVMIFDQGAARPLVSIASVAGMGGGAPRA